MRPILVLAICVVLSGCETIKPTAAPTFATQNVFQALDEQYHQGRISESEYLEKRQEVIQILGLALQADMQQTAQRDAALQNAWQRFQAHRATQPVARVSTNCTSRPYGGGFAVDCR